MSMVHASICLCLPSFLSSVLCSVLSICLSPLWLGLFWGILFFVFLYQMVFFPWFLFLICHWYFNRGCVVSINCFGWYGHFDVINSSNPWTWYMLPFVCVFLNFFLQCCVVFWVQIFYLLGWLTHFSSNVFYSHMRKKEQMIIPDFKDASQKANDNHSINGSINISIKSIQVTNMWKDIQYH